MVALYRKQKVTNEKEDLMGNGLQDSNQDDFFYKSLKLLTTH